MPMGDIIKSFEAGVGGTLGHIALVIGLGTMLGKMMAESGGAERIALTLIDFFGEKNVHWAMVVIAFIVGLPVFFEVGFVLLCRSPSTWPSAPIPRWCWLASRWWPACRWCTG
jgi:GntP family gluconate:H+ symporter